MCGVHVHMTVWLKEGKRVQCRAKNQSGSEQCSITNAMSPKPILTDMVRLWLPWLAGRLLLYVVYFT